MKLRFSDEGLKHRITTLENKKNSLKVNIKRGSVQALRSELDIVCATAQRRNLSERQRVIPPRVSNTMSMNVASACGFLSVHFLCPLKESGHAKREIQTMMSFQGIGEEKENRRVCA